MPVDRRRLVIVSSSRSLPRPRGFTLVEMLVVLGIIVILITILLPVVSAIRKSAVDTENRALLATLQTAIEAYFTDHQAYPGPIANPDLKTDTPSILCNPDGTPWSATDRRNITMAENLYLGLNGGLKGLDLDSNGSYETLSYDEELAKSAAGPRSLGLSNPKSWKAYAPNLPRSAGDIASGTAGDVTDTVIPEFVDKYPSDAMPIIYVRAKRGVVPSGATMTAEDNPVITKSLAAVTNPPKLGTYDVSQFDAYLNADAGDGFSVCDPAVPFDAAQPHVNAFWYFLQNPGDDQSQWTAKKKDSYILICAGRDRLYGTSDDITSLQP